MFARSSPASYKKGTEMDLLKNAKEIFLFIFSLQAEAEAVPLAAVYLPASNALEVACHTIHKDSREAKPLLYTIITTLLHRTYIYSMKTVCAYC